MEFKGTPTYIILVPNRAKKGVIKGTIVGGCDKSLLGQTPAKGFFKACFKEYKGTVCITN